MNSKFSRAILYDHLYGVNSLDGTRKKNFINISLERGKEFVGELKEMNVQAFIVLLLMIRLRRERGENTLIHRRTSFVGSNEILLESGAGALLLPPFGSTLGEPDFQNMWPMA